MPGEQLLLINPRRRRRRAKSHRRRRHVARRRRRHVARATPIRRRRRRSHARVHHRRRRHVAINPRRRRRVRRNPSMLGGTGLSSALVPVASGAAGAVLLDIVWGYISPMFGTLLSGSPYLNLLAKAGLAVGGGIAIGKVTSRRTGHYVMAGALTVYGYQLLESIVKGFAPTIPFAGFGAYLPMAGLGRVGCMTNYNPAPYLMPPGSAPLAGSYTGPCGQFGAYMQPGMSGIGGGGMGMF